VDPVEKNSLSKIIKSENTEQIKFSNYEYKECQIEGYIPIESTPGEIKKFEIQDFEQNSSLSFTPQSDIMKKIDEDRKKADDLRIKAEVYLDQAKERSESKFQEAYEKGYKQGHDEGFRSGELKQKSILESYSQELSKLSDLREELIKQSEKSIINLVLKICKKILQAELSLNPDLVGAIVKASIERAISPGQMKLRLHPDDAKYVQENLNKITGSSEIARNIVVERDDSIIRGSCIVTNNYGDVDARIEEQLKEIERECLKFLD
jgi:flagellar biosynthesis/type III secretory pathway protein FliH